MRRVDEAENILVKRTATLSEARALLASRKDLLEQQEQIEQFVERQDQVVRDLLQLVEFQERDVEKLTNRVNLTQEQARQAIEQSYRSSLLSRHPFSANQFGLDHGFRDLLDVPRQATDWVSSSLEEVWDRLRLAEPLHWLMIAVCIVILLAGATGLARLLDWVLPANIARHWEVACVAVRPLIWWLVPLGAWLVMISVLDLGSELGPPIFIALLAIPVTRFLLRTARTMLTGMAGERPEGRAAVAYGQFRLAIYLGVLTVVMGGLVRWVEISPAVGDLFNLVSMLALLGTAVLTLRVRKSLPDLDMPITGRDRPAEFALYVMSVAAITISVIGLTGYTDLAWLILFHLGWLVLVITLAWMAIQVVRRTARKLQSRLDFSGLDSVFWLRSLVVPAALIVQAVIVLAGLVALYMGFQWELPSPFANWLMTVTGLRDVDVAAFLETETGHLVRRAVIEIGIALLLAYVVWELARAHHRSLHAGGRRWPIAARG